MKVLLLGEYSSLHKGLADGLRQIDDHMQVDIAASGDGWKKIGGATLSYPVLRSKNPVDRVKYLDDQFRFIRGLDNYDVIQMINPGIFSAPLRRRLYAAVRKNARLLSLAACGDDYRVVEAYRKGEFRYYPYDFDKTPLAQYDTKTSRGRRNRRNELWLEKNVDTVIPNAYEYSVGYSGPNACSAIPFPINVDEITYSENTVRDKLVFFHGLNREAVKGTSFIREAMERLAMNYQNEVEIILDGHMPYDKYVQVMRMANVVLDQCTASAYGINGCIAMAQGKVLMSGNTPEMRKTLQIDDCPVIHIEPDVDQIYSQLEWIVKNRDSVLEIGKRSREYVERYHDCKIVAIQYLEAWKSTGKLNNIP